jgi:cyanophycinase-like exopeptidase
MTGAICLQGGNEFTDDCREMDERWLARVPGGVVAIAPLACAVGVEYRTAAHNGAEYLRDLGVTDIVVAPEPSPSLDGAVRTILDAAIVVIPGGSPTRIRTRVVGTAIGGALRAHLSGGGTVVGASAGAMVLAATMLVPGSDMQVHPGLGAVPDVLVLPHYGEPRSAVVDRVLAKVDEAMTVLGIPACSGVLYDDGEPLTLGGADCWRFVAGREPAIIPHA